VARVGQAESAERLAARTSDLDTPAASASRNNIGGQPILTMSELSDVLAEPVLLGEGRGSTSRPL
jgi:hypothetical protein